MMLGACRNFIQERIKLAERKPFRFAIPTALIDANAVSFATPSCSQRAIVDSYRYSSTAQSGELTIANTMLSTRAIAAPGPSPEVVANPS